MREITISYDKVAKIQTILNQYGGPVKNNYTSKIFTDLTQDLINDVCDLIDISADSNTQLILNNFQYFALLRVLDYFLLSMGVGEFQTVTGKSYYEDGIVLLYELREQFK